MLDMDSRLRVARGIAKTETEASHKVFQTLKTRGHPDAPPPTMSDGWGGIDEALIAVYGISGQRDGGVFSTAKHFPGYGGITYDPENEQLAVVPDLPEISQFQVAAAANLEFVMTANVVYSDLDPELPFTLSPTCIAYLRSYLTGDYLIVSDDLATAVLKEAYGLEGTVTRAAQAGVDVLLVCGHEAGDVQAAFTAVIAAVQDGTIGEGEIDERVNGIPRLKEKLSY